MAKLFLQKPGGGGEQLDLHGLRVTVGRSRENDFFFQEDVRMSRKHFALARRPEGWAVRDLGSRNGTWVNGERVERERVLQSGDVVSAGGMVFRYRFEDVEEADADVEFVAEAPVQTTAAHTTIARLRDLLDQEGSAPQEGDSPFRHPAFQALIHAGRELAGHSDLDELFRTILTRSIEAVHAERGVLMTLEEERLVPRASHGEGFQISTTVRDKVLQSRNSLLLRDTRLDEAIAKAQSIDLSATRSLLAVPLQTDEEVLGLIYLDTSSLTRPFTRDDLNLMTVLANVAATRIHRERMAEVAQYQKLLEADLERAAGIQQSLLPQAPPQVPGLDLAALTVPCRTVGGDYHDFFATRDGGLFFLVGDVSGKGIPASLVMTGLHARMHVLVEEIEDPAELVGKINRSLADTTPDNCFVSLLFARVDPKSRDLIWCNAGHNPPLLVSDDGGAQPLEASGPVLGILPEVGYETRSARLEPGDVLVCFSDGVTEAVNAEDEEFGEERLSELIRENRERSSPEILDAIRSGVEEWSGAKEFADDLTLLVVKGR